MSRVARLVFIALLLVAVPLRGFAGSLMLFCDSHENGAPAVTAQQAPDPAADHHGHAHEESDNGIAPHAHESDAGHDHASGFASVCSLCASCCTAAGLTSQPILTGFGVPRESAIPFFAYQVSDFVPDHLDRPPSVL